MRKENEQVHRGVRDNEIILEIDAIRKTKQGVGKGDGAEGDCKVSG